MDPISLALALCARTLPLFLVAAPTDFAPRTAVPAAELAEAFGGFVENVGQAADGVRFVARRAAAELGVDDDRLVFIGARGTHALRMPGAATEVRGEGLRATRFHHFRGAVQATNARSFDSVRMVDVAPGIDVVVRADGPSFAYDLVLAADADLDAFEIAVEGGDRTELTADGAVLVRLRDATVEHRIGACWEVDEVTGERHPIPVRFRAGAEADRFGFATPGRSPARPLVIDPSLIYCTYIGSAGPDVPAGVAVDRSGNLYVLGKSTPPLPATPGAYQEQASPNSVWVAKLSAGAGMVEWATHLSGSNTDQPIGIALAPDGSIVVTGQTWSVDFPTTANVVQPHHDGTPSRSDVFVSRLSPDGDQLIWSTFLGGNEHDAPECLAVAPNGDVVVALRSGSQSTTTTLEATPGAFDTAKDAQDRMIARFAADGSFLSFATWFPIARFTGIATDADGNVYFTGDTNSMTGPVPTTPGAFQLTPKHTKDGVVGKFDPTGSTLRWCTYVGSSKADTPWGIAVDAARAVYIVGQTTPLAVDYPTTPGAFSQIPFPSGVAFATKLLADGSGLVWSTLMGSNVGGGGGFLYDALVDGAGNLTSVGFQNQPGWPLTPDAYMSYLGAFPSPDLVLTKFNAVGSGLVYSTYFGGSATDYEPSSAMDLHGCVHVLFHADSWDLPTGPNVFQPAHGSPGVTSDMGLVGFDLGLLPWRLADTATRNGPRIPNLVGIGPLTPSSPTRLSLRGGLPGGLFWLVAGAHEWSVPMGDWILYPSPDVLLPLQFDASGGFDLTFPWLQGPANLFFQVVGFDPADPALFYASNGLRTAKP
jgi:hypothetical protein